MDSVGAGDVRPAWLQSPALTRVSLLISVFAVGYGLYRGYYALGGTAGMFGEPSSRSQWRLINGLGAIAILVAAGVPLAALVLSRWRYVRMGLIVLFSLAAVGLAMHALIDELQRALSLTGLATRWQMTLPASSTAGWVWKDQRTADLQDALLNEPWFLLEGLLCGAVVWIGVGPGHARRWWLMGMVAAALMATGYGALVAIGVVGQTILF